MTDEKLNVAFSLVNTPLIGQQGIALHNSCMDQISRIDKRLRQMQSSWADMGRAIGATDQRLTNWKKRGSVSKTMEARVAHYLGTTVDWLKTGDEVREPAPGYQANRKTKDADPITNIDELLRLATPESRKQLEKIARAAAEGLLDDDDVQLLQAIANRLTR